MPSPFPVPELQLCASTAAAALALRAVLRPAPGPATVTGRLLDGLLCASALAAVLFAALPLLPARDGLAAAATALTAVLAPAILALAFGVHLRSLHCPAGLLAAATAVAIAAGALAWTTLDGPARTPCVTLALLAPVCALPAAGARRGPRPSEQLLTIVGIASLPALATLLPAPAPDVGAGRHALLLLLGLLWLTACREGPGPAGAGQLAERLVAGLTDPVLVVDASGVVRHANDAAMAHFGPAVRGRLLETPEADTIRVRETALPATDGKDRGRLVLLTDLAEARRLEALLEDAACVRAATAEAAGTADTRFVASVSHELRTPLGAVVGYAELLKDGLAGELPGPARDLARRIHETGRDLLEDVHDLLDLEKTAAGALRLRPERLALDALRQDLVHALGRRLEGAPVHLDLDLEDPRDADEVVLVDGPATRRVLTNLVHFLVARTPAEGAVVVRLSAAEEGLLVHGEQQGPGVRAPVRRDLEAPYWQTFAGASREGSGGRTREPRLGLALVRRLVATHGGHLSFRQDGPDQVSVQLGLPALQAAESRA